MTEERGQLHLLTHLTRIALGLDLADARAAGQADAAARARAAVIAVDDALAEQEAEAAAVGVDLPIVTLASRFELDGASVRLLVAAAVPGLDVDLAMRWQVHAGGDEPERRVHQLIELLALDEGDGPCLLGLLAADGPLRRGDLVELVTGPGWAREAPLLQRRVYVPGCIVAALRGEEGFDSDLAGVATRVGPDQVVATARREPALDAALADGRRPLVVVGAAGVGKATAVAAAAARLGRQVVLAELSLIVGPHGASPEPALRSLRALTREARRLGDVLVLRVEDGLTTAPVQVQRAVLDLAGVGGAVLITRSADLARRLRAPEVIELAGPDADEQRDLWRRHLGPAGLGLDLDAVVARCPLPAGEIREAAQLALGRARGRGELGRAGLEQAARDRLRHRLGEVASVVTTSLTWADLVVRDEVRARLREIVAAVEHRALVLDGWGFGAILPYGRAVSALLAGPPGTGKTMAASLIAQELGLELFRIDLSKIVSKWLGETEKNLGLVFDEAERVGAVLLFDEADALFARRTEVKSSNDRTANLQVNFLLQRLEQHPGVVLLTTNARTGIDEAFLRRLRYRIEFSAPDAAERELLWRSMIPARAPLSTDVDLTEVAERYELAGGHIKNAVVRAAFMAAERGGEIDHDTLVRAAALEWTELGNLPT
ncbi:MAG: ATP-binding protein [Kofleriaceae bacterium]|nr:ATP-binding protein [Kofleriaceae bacterium]MBP6837376.1 ATP-binding protein [Kofleriaceae bacterium]MBP9202726.1 ATP-binding protein [Kofleriaceae bacterium]